MINGWEAVTWSPILKIRQRALWRPTHEKFTCVTGHGWVGRHEEGMHEATSFLLIWIIALSSRMSSYCPYQSSQRCYIDLEMGAIGISSSSSGNTGLCSNSLKAVLEWTVSSAISKEEKRKKKHAISTICKIFQVEIEQRKSSYKHNAV